MTDKQLYEALIAAGYKFPADFDINAPLFSFDVTLPLMPMANIQVSNSLQ